MLPVTSGACSSQRDKSVLATAIKQLKRRFGRKLRRALKKRRLALIGLTVVVLVVWWTSRSLKTPVSAVSGLIAHLCCRYR